MQTESSQPQQEAFGLTRIWSAGASVKYLTRFGVAQQLTLHAFRSIIRSPLVSAVALLTIAIALFILSSFLLVLQNADRTFSGATAEITLTVFLDDRVSTDNLKRLRSELEALTEVQELTYRNKDQALKEFRQSLGPDAGLLEGLEEKNPLPASIELRLKPEFNSREDFERLQNMYRENPAVERITYSSDLVGQIAGLVSLFRQGGFFVVLLLLLVTGLIVAMTISLALYSRRDEIYIMRLVGAAPHFVSVPCMIEGAVLGLIGSILALFGAYGTIGLVRLFFEQADLLRQLVPELEFLAWGWCLLVICTGVAVGIAGSAVAVRRFSDGQEDI